MKRIIILFILGILAIISVIWIYSKSKNSNTQPLPTIVPKIFELSNIAPKNGVDVMIIPTTAIEFTFNKSINPNSVVVNIDPAEDIKFETSENRRHVYVRPTSSWEIGKLYTITLSLESDEGEKIENINYQLKLKKITESDFNEAF